MGGMTVECVGLRVWSVELKGGCKLEEGGFVPVFKGKDNGETPSNPRCSIAPLQ